MSSAHGLPDLVLDGGELGWWTGEHHGGSGSGEGTRDSIGGGGLGRAVGSRRVGHSGGLIPAGFEHRTRSPRPPETPLWKSLWKNLWKTALSQCKHRHFDVSLVIFDLRVKSFVYQ